MSFNRRRCYQMYRFVTSSSLLEKTGHRESNLEAVLVTQMQNWWSYEVDIREGMSTMEVMFSFRRAGSRQLAVVMWKCLLEGHLRQPPRATTQSWEEVNRHTYLVFRTVYLKKTALCHWIWILCVISKPISSCLLVFPSLSFVQNFRMCIWTLPRK